jgi:putative acetyltransferase
MIASAVGGIAIRMETAADAPTIRAVLQAAFAGDAEAELLVQLRKDGDLLGGLVAENAGNGTVGYVAFVRLAVEVGPAAKPAAGLAPLAVTPTEQRRGIGSALVLEGLEQLKLRGEQVVFVLGDPAFYSRFGFCAGAAAAFASPYAGPHFMALPFTTDAPTAGRVSYPVAFSRFD